jgi:hypothetical protein
VFYFCFLADFFSVLRRDTEHFRVINDEMKDLVAQVFRPYPNSRLFYSSRLTDFSASTVRYILENVDDDHTDDCSVNGGRRQSVESDEDLFCDSEEDLFANSDDDNITSPPRRRRKLFDGRAFVRSGVRMEFFLSFIPHVCYGW